MTLLEQLSKDLAHQAEVARAFTVEIRSGGSGYRSGTLWRPDVVITSEQVLGKGDSYDVVVAGQTPVRATLAGRDPGTNVAVLKLETALPGTLPAFADPPAGSLALACGADGHGGIAVHLGVISAVAPEWRSRAGGRIDRRIMLDVVLSEHEEGGPVLDASGALIGMSTLGHHGAALAIPHGTIVRSVELLLQYGRIERGWLGVALQPVAVPEDMRAAAGQDSALMVMGTEKDGPAAAAGILTGDVLLQIDGVPLTDMRAGRLGPDSVGRQVEVKLIRAGAIMSVTTTITAHPAGADDWSQMAQHWAGMAEQWGRMAASRWQHHHHHHGGRGRGRGC